MAARFYTMKIIGYFCIVFSIALLPPILISEWYQDGELGDFLITFLTLSTTGFLLCILFKSPISDIRRRDSFLIVALFWLILSFISALPFMIGPDHLSIVDSIFEATSGFTTTGATVIPDLDRLSPSLLYYRQQLQWFGGLGLIVIAIAILPILGVGGTQLYRAEIPGPLKEEKITPRLMQTAHNLCLIYIALTFICAASYWIAGMTPLDALEYSFSTISTGGFTTHNESIAYFHSHAVNYIAITFMLMGAINFSIHFMVLHSNNPSKYLHDPEVRTFLSLVISFVLFFSLLLYYLHYYSNPEEAFEYSLFEVTSVITSTGFGITNFTNWPLFLPILLIFIGFIGGCGGSTAGGIKVMRVLVLIKQAGHEIFRIVHPKSVRPIKIGQRILNEKIMQAIWGFFAVYIVVFVALTLSMMLAGLDQVSAFSAVAATINNLGPGLGIVSATFVSLSATAKLLAVAAMLLGRLEIFTLLVILTPAFWRS